MRVTYTYIDVRNGRKGERRRTGGKEEEDAHANDESERDGILENWWERGYTEKNVIGKFTTSVRKITIFYGNRGTYSNSINF